MARQQKLCCLDLYALAVQSTKHFVANASINSLDGASLQKLLLLLLAILKMVVQHTVSY